MHKPNGAIRNGGGGCLLLALVLVGLQMGQGCPSSNPGPTQCFQEGPPFNGASLVTLDGSRSSDPNGNRLRYIWTQLTGTPVTLSDPRAAIATFTAPDTNDTLTFKLTVTDPTGGSDSCDATVAIQCPPTTITQQPTGQSVCSGQTATFTVAATGLGTLTFQWQKNGANLANGGHYSGVTTATLTVSGADEDDVANYACVVTGVCSTVTSNTAALAIGDARITQQPSSQSVCTGTNVAFTVAASGNATLSFRWQKRDVEGVNFNDLTNGGRISGADLATLTVSGAATSDAGDYRCVVANGCGSVTSNTAALAFGDTRITQQPSPQSVCAGTNAAFTVAASGTAPLSFRWQKRDVEGVNFNDLTNGGRISGADSATLTVSGAATSDVGDYRCVVTGGCGNATSDAATLALRIAPVITQQPPSQSICEGTNAAITVAATGDATLSFRWQKQDVQGVFNDLTNGGRISGADSATLTVSGAAVSDAGDYRCVITDACGIATSNAATLTVRSSTAIVTQPSNQSIPFAGTATFTVAASGSGTLTFQWQLNGANITDGGPFSGTTTSTLTVTTSLRGRVTVTGTYRCVVTGDCGTVTSNGATLQ